MDSPMPVFVLNLEKIGHHGVGQIIALRPGKAQSHQTVSDRQTPAADVLAGTQRVNLPAERRGGEVGNFAGENVMGSKVGLAGFVDGQERQRLMMAGEALAVRRLIAGRLFDDRDAPLDGGKNRFAPLIGRRFVAPRDMGAREQRSQCDCNVRLKLHDFEFVT